jgi:hypothetical protein
MFVEDVVQLIKQMIQLDKFATLENKGIQTNVDKE